MTGDFTVFDYHVTGSTGTLFLYGIVVGAVAVAGLTLLLAGGVRGDLDRGHRRDWRHPFGDRIGSVTGGGAT